MAELIIPESTFLETIRGPGLEGMSPYVRDIRISGLQEDRDNEGYLTSSLVFFMWGIRVVDGWPVDCKVVINYWEMANTTEVINLVRRKIKEGLGRLPDSYPVDSCGAD